MRLVSGMDFLAWFARLLAGLPWGGLAAAVLLGLVFLLGLIELKWRFLHAVSASLYAREVELRISPAWPFWPSLLAAVGVLYVSMLGFYAIHLQASAVLLPAWRDGQLFFVCSAIASFFFGLVIVKLLKEQIDLRVTAVLCMLGPNASLREGAGCGYRRDWSGYAPAWIGWALLGIGVFLTIVVPAVGAWLWWGPGGGRQRSLAEEDALEASIARFKAARAKRASTTGASPRILDLGVDGVAISRAAWNGAKWGTVWWFLCWLAWSWDSRAAALAAIIGLAFIWQMASASAAALELMRAREHGAATDQ
jgi:hypothetical protein